MSSLPKKLHIPTKKFTSISEAQKAFDDLCQSLDHMFRLCRADIEKTESNVSDHESRITALEP